MNLRRKVRAEAGMTLAEVLVAVAIMAIGVVTIAPGLGLASKSSDYHRKQVTADSAVRSYGEAIKEYIRIRGYSEEAPASYYSYESVRAYTGYTKPEGINLSLAQTGGVQYQQANDLNVILVVDTSGSIDEAGGASAVRGALKSFVTTLKDTGASLALVSFAENAEVEQSPVVVTQTVVTNLTKNGGTIDDLDFEDYTNWDAGLGTAYSLLDDFNSGSPPLILFVTDGTPNRWIDDATNAKKGSGADFVQTALDEAIKQKVLIEDIYSSRIFALGVTQSDYYDADVLKQISGPKQYPNNPFAEADWMQIGQYSELTTALSDIAKALPVVSFGTIAPRGGDQGAQLLKLTASSDDLRVTETLEMIVRRP